MVAFSIHSKEPQGLNLGSANRPAADMVNLDMQDLPGVDYVYRIDPWYPELPFPDSVFNRINANNIVEHVGDTNALIQEMWRVSVDGAQWYILTPGYRDRNSYVDPTHFSHWTSSTLDFYTRGGFDSRRYEPALIEFTQKGDDDSGLEFFVTVIKREEP